MSIIAVQRTLQKEPVQATFSEAEKIKATKPRGFKPQDKKTGLSKYQGDEK